MCYLPSAGLSGTRSVLRTHTLLQRTPAEQRELAIKSLVGHEFYELQINFLSVCRRIRQVPLKQFAFGNSKTAAKPAARARLSEEGGL